MFKRVFLFLATNFAVFMVLSVVLTVIEQVFWIQLWASYLWLFIFSIIFWFGGSFISLLMSRWVAKKAYWVQVIPVWEYDSLSNKEKVVFDVVRDLSERQWIKIPEVWFYNSSDPNAFATWASKNSSLVAVSSWLLDVMDEWAIKWVIGHEMSHVLNWDMVTMTLLQWVLNTFVIFFSRIIANIISQMVDEEISTIVYFLTSFVFNIVFGILASLITMAFSRYREFKADARSAEFVWKQNMISGLKALKKMQSLAMWDDSNLATMKISTKSKKWFLSLFSTHPELDDRINALEELSL